MVNDFQGTDFKVRAALPAARSLAHNNSFVPAQMLACAAVFLALKVVEAPRQGKVRALYQRWLPPSCCSARACDRHRPVANMSDMRDCILVCRGVL
jgi:hypothetical protein